MLAAPVHPINLTREGTRQQGEERGRVTYTKTVRPRERGGEKEGERGERDGGKGERHWSIVLPECLFRHG